LFTIEASIQHKPFHHQLDRELFLDVKRDIVYGFLDILSLLYIQTGFLAGEINPPVIVVIDIYPTKMNS